jgi:hypothetical protein
MVQGNCVKQIIEWVRILTPRSLKLISIGLVGVLLATGLWPLDFWPKNQVEWLRGENGLRFEGESLIAGRTVGGYARSADHLGNALLGDSKNSGLSIEIWLRSAEDAKTDVPNILSFVNDLGKVTFVLGQWKSSLIIRWPLPGYDIAEKWKEIEVKNAVPRDVRRLITVASDEKGTSIYLDGKLAGTYPNPNFKDVSHGIRDRWFILGNSPSGKGSWSGDVFGLAFYKAALNEKEASESFGQWTKGEKKKNPHTKEAALYLFDEGAGNRVRNVLGAEGPLTVPDHPTFQREVLGLPLINKYNKLSYVKDGVVNILGFVPFGFFLSLWMIKTRGWPRGTNIMIAVGLGGLVSLSIELVQVFIPVRDSSLMDLVCNTFGTVIGVGLSMFAARFLLLVHS